MVNHQKYLQRAEELMQKIEQSQTFQEQMKYRLQLLKLQKDELRLRQERLIKQKEYNNYLLKEVQ